MSDDTAVVAAAQSDDMRDSAELIGVYLDGVLLLRRALEGFDADALRARPIEGAMSALEVLGHISDCEQFLADRMKRTIALDRPLLVGVDGSRYPTALNYHDRNVELQLTLVDVTRRQLANDLARLSTNAWSRTAVHTETGLVTLRQQLLHAVRHLQRHVHTIDEKRAALGL